MKKRWFRQRPWDRESPPNLAAMLAVLSDVAHGMAYLHCNSIIHGDLSTCERPRLMHCPRCSAEVHACTPSGCAQSGTRLAALRAALSLLMGPPVVCLRAANVLLAGSPSWPNGFTAKVADFGLARCMMDQSKAETATYGTATYQPPELLAHGTLSKVRMLLSSVRALCIDL
jgi:serine/threonine protein kinase